MGGLGGNWGSRVGTEIWRCWDMGMWHPQGHVVGNIWGILDLGRHVERFGELEGIWRLWGKVGGVQGGNLGGPEGGLGRSRVST